MTRLLSLQGINVMSLYLRDIVGPSPVCVCKILIMCLYQQGAGYYSSLYRHYIAYFVHYTGSLTLKKEKKGTIENSNG